MRRLLFLLLIVCAASTAHADNILFVSATTGPYGTDVDLVAYLESAPGGSHTVTIVDDSVLVEGDATGKDLVYISMTVSSGAVSAILKDTAVPVIVAEPFVFDNMGMTDNTQNGRGETDGQLTMDMNAATSTHPLAAGLSSVVIVYDTPGTVGWGGPNGNAVEIAYEAGSTSHVTIFAYESGASMVDGTAPAKRVGFFIGNGSGGSLTADGLALLDAAVNWASTPPTNTTPVVDAGAGGTVAVNVGIDLDATVTDDAITLPLTTTWSEVSGPGDVTFTDASAIDTHADFSATGAYVLRLSADDTEFFVSDDTPTITVTAAAANAAPVPNAGPDADAITDNPSQMQGSYTDDGITTPVTSAWSTVSAPAGGTALFVDSTSPTSSVTFDLAGAYTLRLTVTDTEFSPTDDVVITVADPVSGLLFADNFDAQPDWDGVPNPPSVGGKCIYDDVEQHCQNMPIGWNMYRTSGCDVNDHCSGTIEEGPAAKAAGDKALYYWLDGQPAGTTGWKNDLLFSKFFKDNRPGYPEIWIQYEMKFEAGFQFDANSGHNASTQIKLGRITNYMGDGTYNGPEGDQNGWPWASTINDRAHRPHIYKGMGRGSGGNLTTHHYFTPKCTRDGSTYTYCVGVTSATNAQVQTWLQNYSDAKYCEATADGADEQCLEASSPWYTAALGNAKCDDASCNPGPRVPDGSYCSGSTAVQCGIENFDWKSPGGPLDGEWHTWKYQHVMQSGLGVADGIMRFWIDDVLIREVTNMSHLSSDFLTTCQVGGNGGGPDGDGCPDYTPTGFNYVSVGGNAFLTNSDTTDEHWYAIDEFKIATSEAALTGTVETACNDGIDNDLDGATDYAGGAGDTNCTSDQDTSESTCNDNDAEGGGVQGGAELCDGTDLGGLDCTDFGSLFAATLACNSTCDAFDTSGCSLPVTACADGIDNDGDTLTDYPADTNCSSYADDTESDCGDNDQEGTAELCDGTDVAGNECFDIVPALYASTTGSLGCSAGCDAWDLSGCLYACQDLIDNDSDGKIDLADAGCTSPTDQSEVYGTTESLGNPQITDAAPTVGAACDTDVIYQVRYGVNIGRQYCCNYLNKWTDCTAPIANQFESFVTGDTKRFNLYAEAEATYSGTLIDISDAVSEPPDWPVGPTYERQMFTISGSRPDYGRHSINLDLLWDHGPICFDRFTNGSVSCAHFDPSAGLLRLKIGNMPASATDGNALAVYSGTADYGQVLFSDASNSSFDSGNEICTAVGATCANTYSNAPTWSKQWLTAGLDGVALGCLKVGNAEICAGTEDGGFQIPSAATLTGISLACDKIGWSDATSGGVDLEIWQDASEVGTYAIITGQTGAGSDLDVDYSNTAISIAVSADELIGLQLDESGTSITIDDVDDCVALLEVLIGTYGQVSCSTNQSTPFTAWCY